MGLFVVVALPESVVLVYRQLTMPMLGMIWFVFRKYEPSRTQRRKTPLVAGIAFFVTSFAMAAWLAISLTSEPSALGAAISGSLLLALIGWWRWYVKRRPLQENDEESGPVAQL